MSKRILHVVWTLALLLALGGGPGLAQDLAPQGLPLSTGFTYQGRLEHDGEPIDGECAMAFRLFDAPTDGIQMGETISETVSISEGRFTQVLDFGDGVFIGDARWLGIRVMCPGDADFADLGRQELTAAPYATYALQASTAAIASNVETGVITPTHLHGITDSGANGEVLASDGSGSFTWQTPTAPTVRQLVQDFVVASGESVSAGDVVEFLNGQVLRMRDDWEPESVFNNAQTDYIAVSSLSPTSFVIAYGDGGNFHGTAIVGTVSGGTLSWGPESVFNAAETFGIAVSSLSLTSFVVAYTDGGNSGSGTAITGTVSGTTLSWGPESVFNAASTDNIAVSRLSPTDFVIAYRDIGNSSHGTAIVGTVSEGTLSWGSESIFNAVITTFIAVSRLSATDFVIAYTDWGNSLYGTAITGAISGTTLIWGSESVFNAAETNFIAVSSLSPTDFVIAYGDWGNSGYGTAIVGTVSGTTLSWRPASVFNAAATYDIAVSSLSPTDFVVAYRDYGNSEYGTAIVGAVSGTTLSWGPESVFNAATTYYIAVSSLSFPDFIVAYRDDGNSYYGTAIVGHLDKRLIGTARTAASGGETVPVIIDGVSDVHSGLVPGQMYYLQENGALGLTPTQNRVGLAISETALILDQMW